MILIWFDLIWFDKCPEASTSYMRSYTYVYLYFWNQWESKNFSIFDQAIYIGLYLYSK